MINRHPEAPRRAARLLFALQGRWRSVGDLAKALECDRATVKVWCQAWVDHGLLVQREVAPDGSRKAQYTLVPGAKLPV